MTQGEEFQMLGHSLRFFFVIGMLVAVPLALAATGSGSGKLDIQTYAFTTTPFSTSSKTFVQVPAMVVSNVCLTNEVLVSISVNVSSTNMAMEVTLDGRTMVPGVAYFYPGIQDFSKTFAASFVGNGGSTATQHTFKLLMRSLSGDQANLQRALMNVQYEQATC